MLKTCIYAFPFVCVSGSAHASSSPLLRVEKEAFLQAIRAVPAGAQPSHSSSAYSRAALINHHTTDGIDFNLSLSHSLSNPSLTPLQPYMSSCLFNLLSPKSFTHCSASPSHLVPPALAPSLSLSLLVLLSLLYTSHIIELEQCQTAAPLVCLIYPQPLASPAQYLISVRICGGPLRINERDTRLISAP